MRNLSNAVVAASLVACTSLASTAVVAEDEAKEWSANVTFASDYVFRGISQTGEDFALQGGFDYELRDGFYVGTWASNLDESGFNGSTAEVDIYAGVGGAFGNSGFSWDANILYYYYPGQVRGGTAPNANFVEFTPSVGYSNDMFSVNLGSSISDDYFLESGTSFYTLLSVDVPLSYGVGLGLSLAEQEIQDNAAFGTPDYFDWSVSLGKSLFGLDFAVAYHDTDLSDGECFGGSDLCGARAVFSAGKSF